MTSSPMCDCDSLTTSCKSGDMFCEAVCAWPTLPVCQHSQPMAAPASAAFRLTFKFIHLLLFIIFSVLEFLVSHQPASAVRLQRPILFPLSNPAGYLHRE